MRDKILFQSKTFVNKENTLFILVIFSQLQKLVRESFKEALGQFAKQ